MTSRRLASRSGFTLIEILAAVTVLAIMVLFMASVFSNTTKVAKLGFKRVESNNNGRAAIEFVAREISSAMQDQRIELELDSDRDNIYGNSASLSDRIAFASSATEPQVTAGSTPTLARQLRKSVFAVITTNSSPDKGPYALVMHNKFGNDDVKEIYSLPGSTWCTAMIGAPNAGNSSVIADNVRNFEVFVYDRNFVAQPDYKSWVHGPPSFIDVYLEVLAEEDAGKASAGMTDPLLLTAATRRYHTRVFMPNVLGALRD